MVCALHRVCGIAIAASTVLCVALGSSQAQSLDVSADGIQRLLQSQPQLQQQFQQFQQGQTLVPNDLRPTLQLYQPVEPLRMPLAPPSRLEALYSARAGRPLTQ